MTSPIEEQQNRASALPPVRARGGVPMRDWCCGTPITGPHITECVYDAPAPAAEAVSEPPSAPTPTGPVPAAASSVPTYGFKKAAEEDLALPSGAFVRIRKLRRMQVIELKVVDMLDGFGPELLKDLRSDDPDKAAQAADEATRALIDPQTSRKIFGPVDRVVAAAVVCPKVVLAGSSTDEQVNIGEIEMEDKMAIFNAALPDELKSTALGEQLAALKSVRNEPDAGVRDLRDGEAVSPEAQ